MEISYEELVKQWVEVADAEAKLEFEISQLIAKSQTARGNEAKTLIGEICSKFESFVDRVARAKSRSTKLANAASQLALGVQIGDIVDGTDDMDGPLVICDIALPRPNLDDHRKSIEVEVVPGLFISGERRADDQMLLRLVRVEEFGDGWVSDESDSVYVIGTPDVLKGKIKFPAERISIKLEELNQGMEKYVDEISPSLLAGLEQQARDEETAGTRIGIITSATLAAVMRRDYKDRKFKCGDVLQTSFRGERVPRHIVFFRFDSVTKETFYYDGSVPPAVELAGYCTLYRANAGEISETKVVMSGLVHGMGDDGGNEILLATLLAQRENLRFKAFYDGTQR